MVVTPRIESSLFLLVILSACAPSKPPQPANPPEALAIAPVATTVAAKAELPSLLSQPEIDDGWISLFDGETLFGWKAHSKADWQVKEGAIVVESGEPGFLCTTTSFADYVLKIDFRADEKTNSGVFLRTAPLVTKEGVARECYELNIAPADNPFPTGSLVGRKKTDIDCQGDGWRSFEVRCEGKYVSVKYNGEQVLEYVDEQDLACGLIGLQLNSGKVEFKNIKLKPLGLTPMFNGKDLTGWKEYPEMASKFTVNSAGELNVKNGKGQLETEGTYGDFVLQLEAISNAKELNSGIFFRCIPGEQMNGYESQIHNGFKDGARTKPVDCGTGGIFRRVNARRVVPNDLEWFAKTIVADGPHIAVWVNGYQVTDWTDAREPNPNPRNGLRTEAGSLMIQGHDPTTDLSFRKLQISTLSERTINKGSK